MIAYDLAIIGGGTAGLTAAIGAATQGARTLLVERDRTGGDCLWTGCVPSKTLLAAAARAHAVRDAYRFGLDAGHLRVDFDRVMDSVRNAIATIAPHDSVERLRDHGVDVISGSAQFASDRTIAVDNQRFAFRRAMIATGATPVIPEIDGLDQIVPVTSDTVWNLPALPQRLTVLGGGPIGAELAQAFARLGSQVTLIEMADRILPREEPQASDIVTTSLSSDGVDVRTSARPHNVSRRGDDTAIDIEHNGKRQRIAFDQLLVAIGRKPTVKDLGLERVGVAIDSRGAVVVNDRLRTSNRRIYAGGDVTMRLPFTHVATVHGATVVQNALFGLRRRVNHDRIGWVTFTSPEVARLGPTAAEAVERFGPKAQSRHASHDRLDRAVTEQHTAGYAQLVADNRGRIVGATVVGPRAGETIGEAAVWVEHRAKLDAVARNIHAYPTWNQDLADASLGALQARLARYRAVITAVLRARRLLDRRRFRAIRND